jgi:microcompartment protein CcmK/EutM
MTHVCRPSYRYDCLDDQPLDESGNPAGGYLIAVAAVDAGVGERVLVLDEGTGARQILGNAKAPIRSVVVGVVDSVDLA